MSIKQNNQTRQSTTASFRPVQTLVPSRRLVVSRAIRLWASCLCSGLSQRVFRGLSGRVKKAIIETPIEKAPCMMKSLNVSAFLRLLRFHIQLTTANLRAHVYCPAQKRSEQQSDQKRHWRTCFRCRKWTFWLPSPSSYKT